MKLSIGIVGLPNVGKSTLFNLLTKQQVLAANYPFATIDPNVGVIPVPDKRLGQLTEVSKSKKTIPAVVEFYDIAGLVRGAHQGEGLGNQFLTHIRDTQAIVVVLRGFTDPDIIHVEGDVQPLRDLETIETELILKDMETVNKRLEKLEKEAKSGMPEAREQLPVLQKIQESLNRGERTEEFKDQPIMRELQLLTSKRQLVLVNGDEGDLGGDLKERIRAFGADFLVLNLANTENVNAIITKAYEMLGLISFFTTGEDETRAWTIVRGDKAPQAAGVIHTDFEKKFIRAEVIATDALLEVGSWAKAREKGKMRVEGKEYVVADGDVMVIRHG